MELPVPHAAADKSRTSRVESWVAVFIAVTSLAITLYEAQATREHDRMSVWPRISQESSDSAGMFDRAVTNVGLGPALVRSYELTLDGRLRTSWDSVVSELVAETHKKPGFYFSHVGAGTVILPGHTLHVLTILGREFSSVASAQDHRVVSRVCYCSLYGECWIAASDKTDPEPVRACAEGKTATIGR